MSISTLSYYRFRRLKSWRRTLAALLLCSLGVNALQYGSRLILVEQRDEARDLASDALDLADEILGKYRALKKRAEHPNTAAEERIAECEGMTPRFPGQQARCHQA